MKHLTRIFRIISIWGQHFKPKFSRGKRRKEKKDIRFNYSIHNGNLNTLHWTISQSMSERIRMYWTICSSRGYVHTRSVWFASIWIESNLVPGDAKLRWTLFDGYLFKYCSVNTKFFTKYLRRHPSKHIRTKNHLKSFPDASKSQKHQLTCPIELTSGSFLIGRRGILVIPRNRLVRVLLYCVGFTRARYGTTLELHSSKLDHFTSESIWYRIEELISSGSSRSCRNARLIRTNFVPVQNGPRSRVNTAREGHEYILRHTF